MGWHEVKAPSLKNKTGTDEISISTKQNPKGNGTGLVVTIGSEITAKFGVSTKTTCKILFGNDRDRDRMKLAIQPKGRDGYRFSTSGKKTTIPKSYRLNLGRIPSNYSGEKVTNAKCRFETFEKPANGDQPYLIITLPKGLFNHELPANFEH